LFKKIPHLLFPVVSSLEETDKIFDKLIEEMENRFKLLELYESRSLDSYNQKSKEKLPYIIVIIDELADLMMVTQKSQEEKITRLAQLSRAVGIHLIFATQKPIVHIITTLIKANMPTRISFKVTSAQDSRVILDIKGAEKLNGNGDMLFNEKGKIERFQAEYINDEQIKKIINSINDK
jgi:S-DNA-T family DNA segregation ATPase FtsK/SpoIIIE